MSNPYSIENWKHGKLPRDLLFRKSAKLLMNCHVRVRRKKNKSMCILWDMNLVLNLNTSEI